jgi:hypothetical protein
MEPSFWGALNMYVLAHSSASPPDTDILGDVPDFRRATLSMKLTYVAAKKVLESTPVKDSLAVVLGTSFGELQSTYNFFSGIALENVARPLAFQNSLHHSTLGFISRLLSLTGPGFTVSRSFFSGEDAILLAKTLLVSSCEYVLACGVDCVVEELREFQEKRLSPFKPASGAGSLLLAREAPTFPCAEITDVIFHPSGTKNSGGDDFYDSDAIARISKFLNAGADAQVLTLCKPDGSASEILFRPVV